MYTWHRKIKPIIWDCLNTNNSYYSLYWLVIWVFECSTSYMRKLNLKRLRILFKVTWVINRMAKISTQDVDFKTHLLLFIPCCQPFTAMIGHRQTKVGISPITLLGSDLLRPGTLQKSKKNNFDLYVSVAVVSLLQLTLAWISSFCLPWPAP